SVRALEGIRLALFERLVVCGYGLLQLCRIDAGAHAELAPSRAAVEHRVLVEGVEQLLALPVGHEQRRFIEHTLVEDRPEAESGLAIHHTIALAHARMILAYEALSMYVDPELPGLALAMIDQHQSSTRRGHLIALRHGTVVADIVFRATEVTARGETQREPDSLARWHRHALIERHTVQRLEHPWIARATAGRDDRVATKHVRALAVVVLDHHTVDGALRVLNEIDCAGSREKRDVSRAHILVELGLDQREDRTAVLRAPVIPRHGVMVVHRADNRLIVRNLETELREPIEHGAGLLGPEPRHFGHRSAGADLHDVVVMLLWRILDAFRLLEHGSRSTHHSPGD